jgi:protein-L-isoaspartate(D-aspartate) O-methyltransferase
MRQYRVGVLLGTMCRVELSPSIGQGPDCLLLPVTAKPPMDPCSVLARAASRQGVQDRQVLDVVRAVDRGLFVPVEHVALANLDEPVPIGHGQVTTQPSLVAAMLESLALQGEERVLEVGTGYGYQTALLAHLAREVWSIEWWADLAEAARANLAAAGIKNAEVVTGDGGQGLVDHAPYDAIVVSAAFPRVPPPLVDQLTLGGRLVQPIGPGGKDDVTVFVREIGGLGRGRLVTLARFVPLVGAHGRTV